MASQYAGWEIKGEKFFAMGSGPMRAAAAREPLFDASAIANKRNAASAYLETSKLAARQRVRRHREQMRHRTERLTLLVARTSSPAGTVQIVARSVETALHKLHVLGFDLARIERGRGTAPLPPPCEDDLAAIGRTNDAILYGGVVELFVRGDDESLKKSGHACRAVRRPISAGRSPKSSPATTTISIASIRCCSARPWSRSSTRTPARRYASAKLRRKCWRNRLAGER